MKFKLIGLLSLVFINACSYNKEINIYEHSNSKDECRESILKFNKIVSAMCEPLIKKFNYIKKDNNLIYFDKELFLDYYSLNLVKEKGAIKEGEISFVLYTLKKEKDHAQNIFVNEDIRTYFFDKSILKTSYYSQYDKFGKDRININFNNDNDMPYVDFDIMYSNFNKNYILDTKNETKNVKIKLNDIKNQWVHLYDRDDEEIYIKAFEKENKNNQYIFEKELPKNITIHSYYQELNDLAEKQIFFLNKNDYLKNIEEKIKKTKIKTYTEEKKITFIVISSENYHQKHSKNLVIYNEAITYMDYQNVDSNIDFGVFGDKDYRLNTYIKNNKIKINTKIINEINKKENLNFKNKKWNLIEQDYRDLKFKNQVKLKDEKKEYIGLESDLKNLTLINKIKDKSKSGYIEIYAIIN